MSESQPKEPIIFLAMPHYCGLVEISAAQAFLTTSADENENRFRIYNAAFGSSLLANTFNVLWCEAINRRSEGITHFAMLHADIAPEAGFLSKLYSELLAHDADLVSAVVPIKSPDGVTSTAIDSPDPFEVERRLTMSEVVSLPETFSAADCGYPDRALCVNTGCWIADLRKPWVEQVHFQIFNTIQRDAAGVFRPKVMSEDWDFSRQLHRLGAKVLATRKIKLEHIGPARFGNQTAWGKPLDHMAKGSPLPSLVK